MKPQPHTSVRRVFVDTSAYFALADPRDDNAATAQTIGQALSAFHSRQFTTNFILAETHALLLSRAGRQVAYEALHDIVMSATVTVRVSARDELRAHNILAEYDDKDFSLTDATSFAVMERLRIPHAFTFDRNFAQYGLTVLTPNLLR